jgi:hypothetical protein
MKLNKGVKKMNCWHCRRHELIWGGDHDTGKDNEDYDIVT